MLLRKSTIDVDHAVGVISSIAFGAILLVVLLLVVTIILGLSVFTTNSVNVTTIKDSIIDMIDNFFTLMPTVGTILGVVVLIAGIVILVMYVMRMKNQGGQGTSIAG